MPQTQGPTMVHRFGRFLGTNFQGTKGLDRLLRKMHSPERRQNGWMETVARAIPPGPLFHLSTRWYQEWTAWFYGSVDRPIYQWIIRNAKPDWIAFDVGMNFGFYACVLAQRCAQSHGFEPVDWLADRAQANSALNHFTNLQINRFALSNAAGETDLFVPQETDTNWGLSNLLNTRSGCGGSIHIPMDTLDHYAAQKELKRLDFIKLDVEGAEHLVIQGAVESLRAFHPTIIFEMNSGSIQPCTQVLLSIGYKLFDLNGSQLPMDYRGIHDVLAIY